MHATSSSYPAILALYYLKSACFIKIRSGANIFRMPSVISGSGLYHVHTTMLLYISLWPHGSIMFSLDFALLWMQIKWWTVNSTMQYTELAVCLFPSSFLPPLLLLLIRRVLTRDCIAATCLGVVLLHTATPLCFAPLSVREIRLQISPLTIQHSHRTGFQQSHAVGLDV